MAQINQKRGGVLVGYVNIFAKHAVYLVYTPMLLSYLGKAEYGVFQATTSFTLSLWILSFGFSSAYIRFYSRYKVDEDDLGIRRLNGLQLLIFSAASSLALFIGGILAITAPQIFSAKFTQEQVELARWLIVILAASVAVTLFSTVFDAYITAREEFVFHRSRQLFFTLVQPFAAFLFLQAGFGANGVALAQLLMNVVVVGISARYAIQKLGMRFTLKRVDRDLFSAMMSFSFWVFLAQIADILNVNLPNVALGIFSGAETVAVYSVALQIRSVFLSLSLALLLVFTPEIHSMVARKLNRESLSRAMVNCGRYQAIVALYVFGGFIVVGSYFVKFWAGESFSDAYFMALVIVFFTLVSIFQALGQEIRRAKNLHKIPNVVNLVLTSINVAITIFLAPTLGYWAATLGYCVYVLLTDMVFINWYYLKQVGLDMRFFWMSMLKPILVSLVSSSICFVATFYFPVTTLISFFGWVCAYTLLYTLLMLVAVCSPAERMLFSQKFRELSARIKR